MLAKTVLLAVRLLLVVSLVPLVLGREGSSHFTNGSGDPSNIRDGIGPGDDSYILYLGDGSVEDGWPAKEDWVSFEDMFNANKAIMRPSCVNLGPDCGANNEEEEIGQLWNAIQSASFQTNVDHRFILAILIQESKGCVRVRTTNNGVLNPGLMQSHNGRFSCNKDGIVQFPCPDFQIFRMVMEGAAGTADGDGLAEILNHVSEEMDDAVAYYRAARQYNSGRLFNQAQMEDAGSSTRCYASDIANRLTGWVMAPSRCLN